MEDVKKCMYLGTSVTKTGGADEDTRGRIGKACGASNKLRRVWRSGEYSKRTQIKILKSNVVLLLML